MTDGRLFEMHKRRGEWTLRCNTCGVEVFPIIEFTTLKDLNYVADIHAEKKCREKVKGDRK